MSHPFVGKTGVIADILSLKLDRIKAGQLTNSLDRRFLFTGPPGVGKSALAAWLAHKIAGHPINVDFRMGTAVSVEAVRDWVMNGCYRPLQGDFTVRFIDELDTTPATAVTELRGYLDTLPASVLFVATTNRAVADLAEPLQTRFQIWKFDPVPPADIAALLRERHPELSIVVVNSIAQKCAGNVRAALIDAAADRDFLAYRNSLPAAA